MSRLIHGQTVTLIEKKQIGVDDFNYPKYEYIETPVENVLATPVSSDDMVPLDWNRQYYIERYD